MPHLQDRRPEFARPNEPGPTPNAIEQDADDSEALCEQVRRARVEQTSLRIAGGNTKAFYGRSICAGAELSTRRHRGVVHYDPVELVATARAGTALGDLERLLADNGQRLAFEPPHFGESATVGGMVATGLSGPRRPWVGAVRDFVLGVRLITQEGKHLRFGGEVMKNVAGYDLSRLMVGAQGTLGVLTEISFKVLPKPAASACLRLELFAEVARQRLCEWGRLPLPITGAAFEPASHGNRGILHLRLEGGEGSVNATRQRIGGEEESHRYWEDLREHRLPLFLEPDPRPLWRLSLPSRASRPAIEGDWLIDWGGTQVWLRSGERDIAIFEAAQAAGGHATRFTPCGSESSPFTPLPPVMSRYHRQLKSRLDPEGLFNPGRLYADW
ncbi:glycolate oxidase subunit GlcE [Salinicola rhizosphaerae]|uniref:Glycolate oxidase subunit GlcE n=1 Tax=Salinicola rhizosphaerae TaxID=1443141 RepID=A0ABQ3DV53_9GAMM|nr:glycolate oxidase subunit GlcE [Salinicola rhizosphaerae]GHB17408.1 glycolate oxidase subunit GlcE [Salinicola rhizosphaerae]